MTWSVPVCGESCPVCQSPCERIEGSHDDAGLCMCRGNGHRWVASTHEVQAALW